MIENDINILEDKMSQLFYDYFKIIQQHQNWVQENWVSNFSKDVNDNNSNT